MDVSDFIETKFIRAEDVAGSPSHIWVIKSIDTEFVKDTYGNDRIRIHLVGPQKEKLYDLNQGDARKVTEALGKETDGWLGNGLVFEVFRVKSKKKNQLVDAVSLKEARKLVEKPTTSPAAESSSAPTESQPAPTA